MRIGIDATVLHGRYSGVENAVRGLILALADLGTEDEIVLSCGSTIPLDNRLPANVRWSRQRFAPEHRLRRIAFQQFGLPALAERLGLDVLHGPAYVTPIRCRVPTVASIYDLMVFIHPHMCERANRAHYRAVLPRSAPRCRRVIVPSRVVAESVVERLGVDRDRVAVVPLGVDPRFAPPEEEGDALRARERLGLPEGFILYVGNIEPKKGLGTLVRALALARRAHGLREPLVIAGARAWGAGELDRAIAEARVGDSVRLLGYVPDADMPTLYAAATAFAFPSIYEGFGLPPLEAMACGTPVVVSDGGSLPEVTGDAALRVHVGDEDALADALVRLCGDDGLRRRLREQGLRRVTGLTWARHAAAVHSVYREVARGG
jgi:glycosyltransferase involved in cell wall biosynthesis